MARKKKKNVVEKLINNEPVDQINVFVQTILLFLLLISVVASIFVAEFSGTLKMLLGLTLLVMGYNNIAIYKRKGFSILYFLIGLYFIIEAVLEAYGS